jgi:hypothetical protein
MNDDNDESIYDFVVTANTTVTGREIDIKEMIFLWFLEILP